ncbi:hypothetical protein [Vibrio fluvialis]|uniref:hypothetical protein n=1 Tax=Vibrio fluvialis TaxID=676 RepID=UPI003D0CC990
MLNKINNDQEAEHESLGLEIVDIDTAVPLSSPDFKHSHRAVLSFDLSLLSAPDYKAANKLINERIILLQKVYDDYKPSKKDKPLGDYLIPNRRKSGDEFELDYSVWFADEHTMCYVPLSSSKGLRAFKLNMNRLIKFGPLSHRLPNAEKINEAVDNLIKCRFNILSVDDERNPDIKAILAFDLPEILKSVTASDDKDAVRQIRSIVLSLLEDLSAISVSTKQLERLISLITSNIIKDDDELPLVLYKCCYSGANDE